MAVNPNSSSVLQNNQTNQVDDNVADLMQSQYTFNYLVFPSDIGFDQMGHYMVININVPVKGTVLNYFNLGNITERGNFAGQMGELLPSDASKVDLLRLRDASLFPEGLQATLPRWTRRIAESIVLHMPSPMIFNTHNIYQEVSLTNLAGQLALGTAAYNTGLLKGMRDLAAESNKSIGANIVNGLGEFVRTGSAMLANPINPAVEVLFANTPQRQFTFEVMMAPRNEQESEAAKKIIKTLRYHAAPELNTLSLGGTWIPPAEFDITFYNKGVENDNLIKINTCVLERIEVDYAPTGEYSTFRNGHPVAIRLGMGFRELEPVHKKRVLDGF